MELALCDHYRSKSDAEKDEIDKLEFALTSLRRDGCRDVLFYPNIQCLLEGLLDRDKQNTIKNALKEKQEFTLLFKLYQNTPLK